MDLLWGSFRIAMGGIAPSKLRTSIRPAPNKKAPGEASGGLVSLAPRAEEILPLGVISRAWRRFVANPIAISHAILNARPPRSSSFFSSRQ